MQCGLQLRCCCCCSWRHPESGAQRPCQPLIEMRGVCYSWSQVKIIFKIRHYLYDRWRGQPGNLSFSWHARLSRSVYKLVIRHHLHLRNGLSNVIHLPTRFGYELTDDGQNRIHKCYLTSISICINLSWRSSLLEHVQAPAGYWNQAQQVQALLQRQNHKQYAHSSVANHNRVGLSVKSSYLFRLLITCLSNLQENMQDNSWRFKWFLYYCSVHS